VLAKRLWPQIGWIAVIIFASCASEGPEVNDVTDALVGDLLAGDLTLLPSDVEERVVGLTRPDQCGECHTNQYAEWQTSMHAYATRDPVFMAMLNKGIRDTEGKLGQFCVQCHAPVASFKEMLPVTEGEDGFVMDTTSAGPWFDHGVQCVACHSIEEVKGTQNTQVTFSETTYFGPTGSAEAKEAHPMEQSDLFSSPTQQSIMCGSCHDVLNPNGARLEATFSEWYSNEFNDPSNPSKHKTCVDCHMPTYQGRPTPKSPEKLQHRHFFVGVDQALIADFPGKEEQAQMVRALLQDCAELELEYNGVVEGAAEFVVNVRNINNGHNLPSGSTADRQVWVHLRITDQAGALIYESGMLDAQGDLMDGVEGHSLNPSGDPELLAFGQFLFDKEGNHVNFPWEAHEYTDHLIGPGQKAWRDYRIPVAQVAGKTVLLNAVLKYRTFPPFLLRDLAAEGFLNLDELDEVPIIEMETAQATWTVFP
jgi:nitrate reductase cytochrome c-type subunit